MGKLDVAHMPLHTNLKLPINRQDTMNLCVPMPYKKYTTMNSVEETNEESPDEDYHENGKENEEDNIEFLDNQVAGHMNDGKSIGMIRSEGKVLKPITKKEAGEKEIEFYERLYDTHDDNLIQVRELVPKYYGTKTVIVDGIEYNSIILEDLTIQYNEPCVIDIKIGRRTWDPNASFQKIVREDEKYERSKKDVAFCIPGFQVYKINQGNKLCKYDKLYGKSLDKEGIIEALKTFLNADSGYCRSLLVQILSTLWRIQHWARTQRRVRLYSSSILIVYDAKRLKDCLKLNGTYQPVLKLTRSKSLYRPMSVAALNKNEDLKISTGFSGQFSKEGPILRFPSFRNKIKEIDLPCIQSNNTWKKSIHTLKRTHSFQNDYDKDVQNKKQDYTYTLHDLVVSDHKSELWATVKMIDFAHVFPGENCDIDRNYLEGVENLVKIFEEFLMDSE